MAFTDFSIASSESQNGFQMLKFILDRIIDGSRGCASHDNTMINQCPERDHFIKKKILLQDGMLFILIQDMKTK